MGFMASIEIRKRYIFSSTTLHFGKKYVKDKKIVSIEHKPVISVLKEAESVILRSSWLADRNLNINGYLSQSIKVFEDFKLTEETRETGD